MNELITDNKLSVSAARKLASLTENIKTLNEAYDALKAEILAEMEARGLIKLENDEIAIRYIEATDAESFDKTAFRRDHPETYDEYIKITRRAPYIKITIKGDK